MELNKLHISLGTISGIAIFLWSFAPMGYTYFNTYHVSKIRSVMAPEITLVAATAEQLNVTVIQATLSEYRREEYKLQQNVREHGPTPYTTDRLKKVQRQILLLEQKLCSIQSSCDG